MSGTTADRRSSKILMSEAEQHHPFRELVRHFFGRFFDTESLSPQAEPGANVVQTLGLLAAPSAFFVIVCQPLGLEGWSLVAVRYIFVSFSMVVMGFIMVLEWDALFPDRRDYQILMTLPLSLASLFCAKAAALGIFLALFLVDINFFGVMLWPGVDGRPGFISLIAAHLATVVAGGLFAALAMASIQGLLITFLNGQMLRRVSVAVQTLLMSVLVMLLLISPILGFQIERLIKTHSAYLYWFPGFWFAGFYEQLRPATRDPALAGLGRTAWYGLAGSAALFLLLYLPGYRRHARRVMEIPEPTSGSAGILRWTGKAVDWLLGTPVESAIFRFIGQTIMRSKKHRIFLAAYTGVGAALGIMALGDGRAGLLKLPLTLSFILVSGLRAAFNFPSELRANWAFQVSETVSAHPYLTGTRKWIIACAIVPLFLLAAPMEFACFPRGVALFHFCFGVALSVLLMEAMFFDFHKVPFTCAHFPGKINLAALGVIYVFGFTMYSRTMASVESWLSDRPAAAVLFVVMATCVCVLLQRRHFAPTLDYLDAGDPAVRTLGISTQWETEE